VFGLDGLTFGGGGDDGATGGGAVPVVWAAGGVCGLVVCACARSIFAQAPRMNMHANRKIAGRCTRLTPPLFVSVLSAMTSSDCSTCRAHNSRVHYSNARPLMPVPRSKTERATPVASRRPGRLTSAPSASSHRRITGLACPITSLPAS